MEKYNIEKIWITDDAVWIRTADGREASEKFADYQRLRFATPEQRAQFTYDEYGIRWDEVDGISASTPSSVSERPIHCMTSSLHIPS